MNIYTRKCHRIGKKKDTRIMYAANKSINLWVAHLKNIESMTTLVLCIIRNIVEIIFIDGSILKAWNYRTSYNAKSRVFIFSPSMAKRTSCNFLTDWFQRLARVFWRDHRTERGDFQKISQPVDSKAFLVRGHFDDVMIFGQRVKIFHFIYRVVFLEHLIAGYYYYIAWLYLRESISNAISSAPDPEYTGGG